MGLPLNQQKIAEEVALLRLQRRREQAALDAEGRGRHGKALQRWTAVILAVGTVLGTMFTLGDQYFKLLEVRTQSIRIGLDQKLIDLTNTLVDPKAESEKRAAAAVLLSSFGGQAIPVLLLRLRSTPDPEPIYESLALVRWHEDEASAWWRFAGGRRAERFEDTLLDEAERVLGSGEVLDAEHWSSDRPAHTLANFTNLLGRGLIQIRKERAETVLRETLKQLRSRQTSEELSANSFTADKAVCDALQRLGMDPKDSDAMFCEALSGPPVEGASP